MRLDRIVSDLANRIFSRYLDVSARPAFLDIDHICPELNSVTSAYPTIRAELSQLLEGFDALPDYHALDRGQVRISGSGPERWKVLFLEAFGNRPRSTRALCPQTCLAIAEVPNVLQAFFSILEPGKSVPEHCGPYLGYLRYHLGLIVPDNQPPTLVVQGEPYRWREGEGVLFDDGLPHRVDNHCDGLRAVLIIDIPRPMPGFPAAINRFITGFAARYSYGRAIARRTNRIASNLVNA